MRGKRGRKGAQKRTRKTLILVYPYDLGIRQPNPRTPPTINMASAELGVVHSLSFLRFRQFAHPKNTTRWGRSFVGMVRGSRRNFAVPYRYCLVTFQKTMRVRQAMFQDRTIHFNMISDQLKSTMCNSVHCKRRGSEKSHFSGNFLGVLIFSGAPVLYEFH